MYRLLGAPNNLSLRGNLNVTPYCWTLMAAGRSTDEPFWDNYRDIQIAGLNGAEVDARTPAHAHTCCLLTLKALDTYRRCPPPPTERV